MTASRNCRNCGADLSPDIRWCTTCYEPSRELSPRAAVHDGDFVGSPIHEGGQIPRWTRWASTATTFGPWGRVGATALVFATLIPAIAFNGFIYAITFPVLAAVLLRGIWAKGWYVPETESTKQEPAHAEPQRAAPAAPEPITPRRIVRWAIVLTASIAFAYGNAGIKAAVVSFAIVALLVWLWTGFDR
jgi:hypothetical protein